MEFRIRSGRLHSFFRQDGHETRIREWRELVSDPPAVLPEDGADRTRDHVPGAKARSDYADLGLRPDEKGACADRRKGGEGRAWEAEPADYKRRRMRGAEEAGVQGGPANRGTLLIGSSDHQDPGLETI